MTLLVAQMKLFLLPACRAMHATYQTALMQADLMPLFCSPAGGQSAYSVMSAVSTASRKLIPQTSESRRRRSRKVRGGALLVVLLRGQLPSIRTILAG
jgi:hypothetical protein